MSQKKIRVWFLRQGSKLKTSNYKKKLKYIRNNAKWKYKAHATVTFSISALISEIWAFKAKKCGYFGSKGPNKKSVQRKNVLEYVFWSFRWSKNFLIFLKILIFLGHPLKKSFFYFTAQNLSTIRVTSWFEPKTAT